ncbi:MAG: hypothetical protein GY798_03875 [Hyphomicrobiales bacterium]|nr:hypothetical protein [Hyphomicrobiales bacterium]
MNPDEVAGTGRYLQSVGKMLDGFLRTINSQINATTWVGPDAHSFKEVWWPDHLVKLKTVANEIDGFGQSALNNASEQRQASGARSARSGGPAGWATAASRSAGETGPGPTGGPGTDVLSSPGPGDAQTGEIGASSGFLAGSHREASEVDAYYQENWQRAGVADPDNREFGYQCAAWANLRWNELNGDAPRISGDGGEMAREAGGSEDTQPRLGAMVSDTNSNHVMIVEQISADGSEARVSEWNVGDGNPALGHAHEYRSDAVIMKGADGRWYRWDDAPLVVANIPR